MTDNVKRLKFTVNDNVLVEDNMALASVEVDVAVKRVSIIHLGSYRRQSICIQPARYFRITWFNPKHHTVLTFNLL